jgi:hypothetical protein
MIIIDLPRNPVAAKIKWTLKQPTQVNRGEFTGARRVTILSQAPRWYAEVEYPQIVGEKAVMPWRAALARLQGQANAFRLGACENAQRAPSVGAGPVVDGANQTGNLIATRGWFPGAPLDLNFLTINGRLHQVLAPVFAGANGKAVFEIMPHIADGVPDGAMIDATRPYAVMSLADDSAGWTVNPGQRYDIAFSCEEAF